MRRDPSTKLRWFKNEDNLYEEETFNVNNTSIAQTAGLRKLALVLQSGSKIQTVNLCLWGSMGNSFQMSLWNLQNERHQWRRIPMLLKNNNTTTISIALTTTQATNEMSSTTTLLMMKCTPDYPKHRTLKSLHDMV